ncbi:uncharacterized protein LOC136034830 [Artemia franciscana]|uniref:Protein phosphatase 1 regulatory subunit 35 C-terminal domain-containing protein n=1 Tax=Artemia franciscana TaxID=6661 RepID=A0AA88I9I9_ARTSF|nr:hypothetical protein QYM36_003218 [Artemia franciscana]KAK2722949.1 hypothetical protein QYM36_003218 [Artemia franciscana]
MDEHKHLPVRLVSKKDKTVDLIRLPECQPKRSSLVSDFARSKSSVDSCGEYYQRGLSSSPFSMPRLQSTKLLQKQHEQVLTRPSKLSTNNDQITKAVDGACMNRYLNFPFKDRVFANLPSVEVNIEQIVKKAEFLLNKKAKESRPNFPKRDTEPKLSDYARPYVADVGAAERIEMPDLSEIIKELKTIDKETKLSSDTETNALDFYQDITRHSPISFHP